MSDNNSKSNTTEDNTSEDNNPEDSTSDNNTTYNNSISNTNVLNNENNQKIPIISLTPISNIGSTESIDSIEMVEVGPDELVNIRKVVKYKEINNYIKGEVLGQGSFAKVREFIDKKSLKRVAGKIMKINVIKRMGPNVKKNITAETQLVRKFNHKNVMKMFAIHITDTKIYIFMEYCAGILKEILDSAPDHRLPKWQSHHYFCQLIDGLKYLHSYGTYHRDIKEENLLIDNSHVVKIADFGVCHVSNPFAEDMANEYEGTKLFQPPELLMGDTDNNFISGSKFDIWSSGVLLFKMISGLYPFFNNNEDLYEIKSYDNLIYPEIIFKDKQLLLLFHSIFVIDFNKRITIKGIKNHPWIRLKHTTDNDIKVDFPKKSFGDIYRGMTLLERLRVRYEYEPIDYTKPVEFVNQTEYEESIKPKDPNIRSNRAPIRRRQRQRKLTPIRRMIRIGLLSASDE